MLTVFQNSALSCIIRRWATFLLLLAGGVESIAQQYPVTAQLQLTRPYSVYLSDYTRADYNKITTVISVNERDRVQYPVKLRLTLEGGGIRAQTSDRYFPEALYLDFGMPLMLTGADLASYFNPNNLNFEGISRTEFQRNGQLLPEGFYTFTLEVLDYNNSKVVSNPARTNAWIIQNDPPLLNFPVNTDKPRASNPQNIVFQWTPRHTASPNAAQTVAYEFTLVQINPKGRNPNDAIRSNTPIFQTTTHSTSLLYAITEPQLVAGEQYAWRVRAVDQQGFDLFKNQGYSEVYMFQFGDACNPVSEITAEPTSPVRVQLGWEPMFNHSDFTVAWRQSGTQDDWEEYSSLMGSYEVKNLRPATEYEYKVMSHCGSGVSSGYSHAFMVSTPDIEETDFACGSGHQPKAPANQAPLTATLSAGQYVLASAFPIQVLEATASGNGYDGYGLIKVPMLNQAVIPVELKGVVVNDGYQMIGGEIVTVRGEVPQFLDMDQLGNGEEGENAEEGSADSPEENESYADPFAGITFEDTVTIDGTVKEVYENEDGEVVVVYEDAQGNEVTEVLDAEEGEDTLIVDAAGNSWAAGPSSGGGVAASPSNTPPAVGDPSQIDYIVRFKEAPGQQYGLDNKDEKYNASGYTGVELRGENYWVAWKSIESGRQDVVNATVGGREEFPREVGFKNLAGELPSQPAMQEGEKQLAIMGKGPDEEEIVTAYVKVKGEDGKEEEIQVGQLTVKSYTKVRNKVIIVPVNAASAPIAATLTSELNKIYGQAVAEWEVEVLSRPYEAEASVVAALDEGESGILASFPKNMREFNRAFKNSRSNFDDDAYYLFLIDGKGASKGGFMPFKRQFGYIFTGSTSDVTKTIAHELGHGAYRLRHTFSSEAFVASERSTDNLMDYNNGTKLKKYQWDYVHNPENISGWFQDDDQESAMEGAFPTYCIPDASRVTKLSKPGELQSYLMPSGVPIRFLRSDLLKDVTFGGFTCDGESSSRVPSILDQTLSGFTANGNRYIAVLELELIGDNDFLGYAKLNEGEEFDEDKIDDYSYYYFESNVWDQNITLYLAGGAECTTTRESIDFENTELIESLPCEIAGFEEIRLANLTILEQELSIRVMEPIESFWQRGRRYYLNEESQTANDNWITQLWNDMYGPYYTVDDEGFIEINNYNLPVQEASLVQVGRAAKALKEVGKLVRSLAVLMAILDTDLNLSAGLDESDILNAASTSGETDQLEIIAKVIKLREDVIDILRNETLNDQTLREFIHLLYQTNEALKRVFAEDSEFPFYLIDYESLEVKPLEENIIEPSIDENLEEVAILVNDPNLEQLTAIVENPDFDPERYTEENDEEENYSAYVSVREIKYLSSIAGVTQPLFYVGITTEEDPIERYKNETTSTLVGNALNFEIVDQDLDKSTARGIEQVLILLNNNGSSYPAQSKTLDNQRNSTAPSRDVYMYRLIRGYLHLETLRVDWKTYYKRNAKYVENKLKSENQWLENIYIPQK